MSAFALEALVHNEWHRFDFFSEENSKFLETEVPYKLDDKGLMFCLLGLRIAFWERLRLTNGKGGPKPATQFLFQTATAS